MAKVRCNWIDELTQIWVRATGRRVDLREQPWLRGPHGDLARIGESFAHEWAERQGLIIAEAQEPAGLMADFTALNGPHFDASQVDPTIADFYQHTSSYKMDAWSEWHGAFRPFGHLLAFLFSRRLRQLNIPLSPLDTSRGITSRVIRLYDGVNGTTRYTFWIREMVQDRRVVYVGSYSLCILPGFREPCVKVVFPLPNGNASIYLRPQAMDGGLVLHSHGVKFGDPGFYFTVYGDEDTAWARYLPTMREKIHVYLSDGELRTDHYFQIWGIRYLHLHYRLIRSD